MIRQPDFVTQEVFDHACREVEKKKPGLDTAKARLEILEEGLCVQAMHTGSYDEEPKAIAQMGGFSSKPTATGTLSATQRAQTVR